MLLDRRCAMRDAWCVRTTVSIDDDVLLAARHLAHNTGQTLGAALSTLVRQGLTHKRTDGERRGGVTLLPVRQTAMGATLEEVNELRDELG